jgi:hypothetical protein
MVMKPKLLENKTGHAALLILTLLVIATGLCLFDHHAGGHDHGVIDLCLGMLAGAVVVAPLFVLTVLGPATAYRSLAFVPAAPHVLDPPPKRFRRS